VTRRRIAIAGIAVAAVYLAAAMASAHLSVLARRPLLDGLAPPEPYRWVDPPRALEQTNRPPTPGTFTVGLGRNGSRTAVLTTDDAQVTLILARGAFPASSGQRAVEVTMTPVAPDEVEPPEAPLRISGNVVRLEATYQPSGDPVPGPLLGVRVVLVYPFTAGEHGSHTIISSSDGETWTTPETNDLPSIQQADALIETMGYVAIGQEPAPPRPPGRAGASAVAAVGIVVALGALSVAVVLLLRRR
jgi:hypothetical protein